MSTWGLLSVFLFIASMHHAIAAKNMRMAFEKLTDYDYRGTSYYTAKNLTLSECQGWCRQEPNCLAAAFSFVPNPLTPVQETLCQLQNETQASNPTATAQRAVNMYYMVKVQIRSDNVCVRPWTFERVPNKAIRGLDNALIYTSSKEACLAACLNEQRFVCRSAEYNYASLQCHLSDTDRRTAGTGPLSQLVDSPGVDYFENLCLNGGDACKEKKSFIVPRIGVADDKVSQYVSLNFYVDKELQAPSESACKKACETETEFLCRSALYRLASKSTPYNCQLFHLDHRSLPDGPSTFLTAERPLIDTGDNSGTYFENHCEPASQPSQNLPVSIDKIEDNTLTNDTRSDVNCDKTGTCYDVTVNCKDTRIAVQVRTNKPFNGRIYALGRSETCNIDVVESDTFRLDLTMQGQDCNTQSVSGIFTNTVILQHHSVVMTKADKIYKVKCTYDMSPKDVTFGMMPIRDPEMISITSAPEAPPPRIRIVDAARREVETVRIGDKLTFRIEIPDDRRKKPYYDNTYSSAPYGIFARSCVAMAKDSKSTFEIIDEEGCPVDPSIFPGFIPDGNALQSVYEAFRFTESYGVIFQCNVKYCLGPCEPAVCDAGVESWGKRRRRRAAAVNATEEENEEDMSISQEILVLDLGDDKNRGFLKSPLPGFPPSADFGEEPIIQAVEQQCSGRGTLLALSVSCALLALLYVSTVTCYCARSWLMPKKGFANA